MKKGVPPKGKAAVRGRSRRIVEALQAEAGEWFDISEDLVPSGSSLQHAGSHATKLYSHVGRYHSPLEVRIIDGAVWARWRKS